MEFKTEIDLDVTELNDHQCKSLLVELLEWMHPQNVRDVLAGALDADDRLEWAEEWMEAAK